MQGLRKATEARAPTSLHGSMTSTKGPGPSTTISQAPQPPIDKPLNAKSKLRAAATGCPLRQFLAECDQIARSRSNGAGHEIRVGLDDLQVGFCGLVGLCAVLLPVAQCADRNVEPLRELRLRQA